MNIRWDMWVFFKEHWLWLALLFFCFFPRCNPRCTVGSEGVSCTTSEESPTREGKTFAGDSPPPSGGGVD